VGAILKNRIFFIPGKIMKKGEHKFDGVTFFCTRKSNNFQLAKQGYKLVVNVINTF